LHDLHRKIRKQLQDFPVAQTFSRELCQLDPDNINYENKKQDAEDEQERAKERFDDVAVEFFKHGANLPKN
jgi:outer membrane murein-binding lipoprotein Lpp